MLALKRTSGASGRDLLEKLPAAGFPSRCRGLHGPLLRRALGGPELLFDEEVVRPMWVWQGISEESRRAAGSGWPPTSRAEPGSGATDISAQCASSTSGCDWLYPSSIEEPERGLSRLLPLATATGGGQRPRPHARRDGRFAARGRRVLLTKRADDGTWCLPAGAAEPGGSFARTAIDELAEETGVEVSERDLIPFGCLSEAEAHTIHYPNGDVTHCFALLFLARTWQGDLGPTRRSRPRPSSSTWAPFPTRSTLPPAHALELLAAYLRSGSFQVR